MPKDKNSSHTSRTESNLNRPKKKRQRRPDHRKRKSDASDITSPEEISNPATRAANGVIRGGPSQPGSFFQSSSDVTVTGGQFSSSRHHHTNFTINVNPYSGVENSMETIRSISHQDTTPPIDLQESGRGNGPVNSSSGSPQETQEDLSFSDIRRLPHHLSLPIQKSSTIYFRHLSTKGRGSPLWIPEPNKMLPVEYQRKGISVGDVGILTNYGSFDFLFNICLPANNPINPEEMPDGFYPVKKPGPRDMDVHWEFQSNSYLASSLVGSSRCDGESPGLIFESSALDGAVLTMPNGSESIDLGNVTNFRKYIVANAEKWYKYVNEVRGREVRNGDLRLVVGYNTSSAWGMATFANLSEQSASRLKFKPTGVNSLGGTYGWEYSGMAEVKSGPDIHEVERLRNVDQQGEEREGPVAYTNQCLFVRTINVTLQDDVWNKLTAEWATLYLDYESQPSTQDLRSSSGASSSDVGSSVTGLGSRDGASFGQAEMDNSDAPFTPRTGATEIVHISNLPAPLDLHPSKIINKLLLKARPDMRMAITEDKDWIFVLDPSEKELPPSENIFSRMMVTHDICEDEGAVFLQPKSAQFVRIPEGQNDAEYYTPLATGLDEMFDTNEATPWPIYDASTHNIELVDQGGIDGTLNNEWTPALWSPFQSFDDLQSEPGPSTSLQDGLYNWEYTPIPSLLSEPNMITERGIEMSLPPGREVTNKPQLKGHYRRNASASSAVAARGIEPSPPPGCEVTNKPQSNGHYRRNASGSSAYSTRSDRTLVAEFFSKQVDE